MAELINGEIKEYDLSAVDFGVKEISLEDVRPIKSKGEYSLRILKGEIDGPRLSIILANAAVLFYLAGKSSDLKECYKLAEEIFRSGKAYQTMLAVKEAVPINSS